MNICQQCHYLNPDLVTHCEQCGAVLIPPLVPQHLKEEVGFLLDDHLQLGRISSLEFNLESSQKNMEEMVDYLEKQSFNNLHLAVTVEKLIDMLVRKKVISRKALDTAIRDEMQGQLFGFEQRQYLESRLSGILESYRGQHGDKFARLLNHAIPMLYTSRHERGMQLLRRALKMSTANVHLLQVVAEIHFITGNYSAALDLLGRIRSRRPSSAPANLLLALVSLKRGDYRRAQSVLKLALKAAPGSFTGHFLDGVTHFLLRDYLRSASGFRKAYHHRPIPQVTLLSSMAHYLGQSPGRADVDSRQALPQMNRSGFFHFLAGLISRKRHWSHKAETHFRQAVRRNQKWEAVLKEMDELDDETSVQKQTQIFTTRLHREMEDLMGILISEIQNIE